MREVMETMDSIGREEKWTEERQMKEQAVNQNPCRLKDGSVYECLCSQIGTLTAGERKRLLAEVERFLMMKGEVYVIEEVAEMLGLSLDETIEWLAVRSIESKRIGPLWLVPKDVVDAVLGGGT